MSRGVLDLLDDLVDRHRPDRHRAGVDDRLADAVDVPAGGQVHHRVGAEVDGGVQLLQFVVHLAGDGRVADVRVDLARRRDADGHRLQLLRQVDRVRGDDHPAAGDLGADQFRVEVLAAGDELHLGGDGALAGGFELGHGGQARIERTGRRCVRTPRSGSPPYAGVTRFRFGGCVLSPPVRGRHPWRFPFVVNDRRPRDNPGAG